MSIQNNPYELYKILPRDNCGRCLLPSCMAFAAAVIRGSKRLDACPCLEPATLARLEAELKPRRSLDQEQEAAALELQQEVAKLDFAALAPRIGSRLQGERLAVSCLGKDFFIDRTGRLDSDCHVNAWVQLPLLRYLLVCRGAAVRGEWLPLSALAGGQAAAPLFAKRCEEPLRRLADEYGDDFFAMLSIFAAREISVKPENGRIILLHPLPLVPFRLAYQPPEEGLASSLRISFDRSAEQNSNPEMLHFLGTGIAAMAEKILQRMRYC